VAWADLLDSALWLFEFLATTAAIVAAVLTWGLVVRWLGAETRRADLQADALEVALKPHKTKPPG